MWTGAKLIDYVASTAHARSALPAASATNTSSVLLRASKNSRTDKPLARHAASGLLLFIRATPTAPRCPLLHASNLSSERTFNKMG
jgi:hypothetical protein